jgi:hypothetical protein
MELRKKFRNLVIHALTKDIQKRRKYPLSDFERIRYEVRPGDVLLIEGRSRVSHVIQSITLSTWSHAALYIGRLHDIEDKEMRDRLAEFYKGEPEVQLLIESELGEGTIVSPITKYEGEHIRICRPKGISRQDAQRVINYAISHLGREYDLRQVLDLARFLFPWSFLPRRFRTSLFTFKPGISTKESCSMLLAQAFDSVNFPILPVLQHYGTSNFEVIQRNPKLFTPSDFDYSPFFEIIKYPILEFSDKAPYRNWPWKKGVVADDEGTVYSSEEEKTEKKPVDSTQDFLD